MKFLFCSNFNRSCWETTCINTLQFFFQVFPLFNPIANILSTYKLKYIYVTIHLFRFYYEQLLRKKYHVVMKAEHEVLILQKFGRLNRRVTQKQPLLDIFKIGVLKKFVIFTGRYLRWGLFIKVSGLSPRNFIK